MWSDIILGISVRVLQIGLTFKSKKHIALPNEERAYAISGSLKLMARLTPSTPVKREVFLCDRLQIGTLELFAAFTFELKCWLSCLKPTGHQMGTKA